MIWAHLLYKKKVVSGPLKTHQTPGSQGFFEPHGFEGEKGPPPASSPILASEEEKSAFREA